MEGLVDYQVDDFTAVEIMATPNNLGGFPPIHAQLTATCSATLAVAATALVASGAFATAGALIELLINGTAVNPPSPWPKMRNPLRTMTSACAGMVAEDQLVLSLDLVPRDASYSYVFGLSVAESRFTCRRCVELMRPAARWSRAATLASDHINAIEQRRPTILASSGPAMPTPGTAESHTHTITMRLV